MQEEGNIWELFGQHVSLSVQQPLEDTQERGDLFSLLLSDSFKDVFCLRSFTLRSLSRNKLTGFSSFSQRDLFKLFCSA